MRKILPLFFILQSCIGAGDMFSKRTLITGNYYLAEKEGGGYDIVYKIDGSYIGRNPSNSRVMAYAVKDSLLIMKSQDYKSNIVFYVLNMNKDEGYSKEVEIYLDTIPEGSFRHSWISAYRFTFIPVK
jgi:hypothetical protein